MSSSDHQIIAQVAYLVHQIDAEDDLDSIVDDDGRFQFESRSVTHQFGTERRHKVDIGRTNQQCRDRRTHQEFAVHSAV